ncbi:hypothetical protein D3C85_1344190 [compost metagenome]
MLILGDQTWINTNQLGHNQGTLNPIDPRGKQRSQHEIRRRQCVSGAEFDVCLLCCCFSIHITERRNAQRSFAILLANAGIRSAPAIRAKTLVGNNAWCCECGQCRHMLEHAGRELTSQLGKLTRSSRIVCQRLASSAPKRNMYMDAVRARVPGHHWREGNLATILSANLPNNFANVDRTISGLKHFDWTTGNLELALSVLG